MTRRALIVGASGGIGRGIALRLAGEGWHILAHGRDPDALAVTLDAVIWSAGGGRSVASGPGALGEWDRTLAAILHAPMRLTALTLDAVRAAEGAYLYVCGMYAKMGVARMAAHCAARHGLEGFAKALFEEVREDGVRVTLVHPGFVATPLTGGPKLDPAKMIQVADIADMAALAVTLPATACVTEMTVRPQRSPYRAG